MTIQEEKDEVIRDYTQEKILGYDKIVSIIKEVQLRIEGLDRKWKTLLDKEKEENDKKQKETKEAKK